MYVFNTYTCIYHESEIKRISAEVLIYQFLKTGGGGVILTDFGRIQKKRVDVGTVLAAWRPLKLGPATHMSRMQQWGQRNKKHSLGGVFDSKVLATKAWVKLVKGGSFGKAARLLKQNKAKAAWQTLQIYNPFLKYLLYRNMALWCPKLGGLNTVGDGAKEVLKEICPNKASWEEKLLVHNKVLQAFPVQDMT